MQEELFHLLEKGHAELKEDVLGEPGPACPSLHGELHIRMSPGGQGAFGLLGQVPDPGQGLQGQSLLRKGIFTAEIGLDGPVDVVPAQMVIPGHGYDFYHIVEAFHIGQVQRPASEIKDD